MAKRILALLLVLCLVFALVACGGTEDEETAGNNSSEENSPVESGEEIEETVGAEVDTGETVGGTDHEYTEITVGSMGSKFVGHFDATSGFSTDVSGSAMALVFDRLFYVSPETREYVSDVLADWSFDTDTLVVTLTLKDDVTFTSGDTMKAEDLLFSFQRGTLSAQQAANWAKYVDLENSSVSDDNLTCYVQFLVSLGTWQRQLASVGIMNQSWVEEHGGAEDMDYFDISIVDGSGPYVPTEFEIGVSTTYEIKDDWWNAESISTGFCYANKITCLQYTDETTMMVDYENDVLDIALSLSTTSMERVLGDASLGTAQSVSSNAVAVLTMDYDVDGNELLENESLRKAICYGTPAEDLAELGYGILYDPAESYIASTSKYCVTGYTYEYDPELAQFYLDESGLTDVTLKWVVNSGSSAAEIAEAFDAYMNMIGIDIDVQVNDILTCISIWETEGGTDLQMICNNNANQSGDPFELLQYWTNSQSFYCANRMGEEINEILNAAFYSVDETVREEKFAEAQEYIYNTYSSIPICEWNIGLAYHGDVTGTGIIDVYSPDLRFVNF